MTWHILSTFTITDKTKIDIHIDPEITKDKIHADENF
jgi:hypothetical protein